jgi:glycosyltransferase involved in cell wall biosynthesis
MNLPLVSVVMPVYNSEKYLRAAIDSILSQSYKNIELIVVDDGSSDSSKEIILSYPDPRVRLLENESNSGIVFSRNKGLAAATGEYIATLDSDDMALPERIEKQVFFLDNNRDYGMCGTFYYTVDSSGELLRKMQFCTGNRDIQTHLTIGNCFCNSTMMIRTKLAQELRYREKYDIVEDYELWYRISQKSKVANLPFYGTYYRVHGNNISVAKMNDMFALVKKINGQILTDLPIAFSEQELETHASLLNGSTDFFKNETHFNDLEAWIDKFYNQLSRDEKYNSQLLFELIAEKWIIVAYKTKRYKKLFYNAIMPLNRRIYFNCLRKRISGKLMRTQTRSLTT